jgi:hypothetical protein
MSMDEKVKLHLLQLTSSPDPDTVKEYADRSRGAWGGINAGSTSLSCLVDSHWMAIANTGDCRLVLAQDGFVDQITEGNAIAQLCRRTLTRTRTRTRTRT